MRMLYAKRQKYMVAENYKLLTKGAGPLTTLPWSLY